MDYELKRAVGDIQSRISSLDHSMVAARRAVPGPRDRLIRAIACHVIGRRKGQSPEAVADEVYGNDASLLRALALPGAVGRSAVTAAQTTVAGWAAELATPGTLEPLQIIAPRSVYARLSAHPAAIRVNLSGRSAVKVPARAPSPSLAPVFVGEGQPIPVRQLALSAASLAPRKAAVISQYSEETLKASTPSIEKVIRATIEFDTANALDSVLLGSTAASAIAPGGILAGISATAGAVGGGLAAFSADVRALALAIETTGPLIAPTLIMSTTSALMLATLTMNAELPIIASPNVPAKRLILIDAGNFASAEGDQAEFSTTKEATLHEESDTPLPLATGSPGAAVLAAPSRSLYQTATVALRMITDASWCMTRANRAAFIDPISW